MSFDTTEIAVKGEPVRVPTICVDGKPVISVGKWMRLAFVHDEVWLEEAPVRHPHLVVTALKDARFPADIFTFQQRIPDVKPRYPYHFEWNNVAAIPLVSYSDWWENRVTQVTRKNVRRAAKRGINVQRAPFTDELVRSIVEVINETPVRQGRRFWHYGKGFDAVKEEHGTFLDRSDFVAAYYGNELVGYVKIVHMGEVSAILNILSKQRHSDKRPTNALLAKSVEICSERRSSYVLYGKYTYGSKGDSSLSEFKRRNGFEEVRFPKYFAPLTKRGEIGILSRLYREPKDLLPTWLYRVLVGLRSRFYGARFRGQTEHG